MDVNFESRREIFIIRPSLIIESKAEFNSLRDSGRFARMASRASLIVMKEVLNLTALLNCKKRVAYE